MDSGAVPRVVPPAVHTNGSSISSDDRLGVNGGSANMDVSVPGDLTFQISCWSRINRSMKDCYRRFADSCLGPCPGVRSCCECTYFFNVSGVRGKL